MQRLEVSGAVRPIHGSLGVKRLMTSLRAGRARVQIPATEIDFSLLMKRPR